MRVCAGEINSPDKGYLRCYRRHDHDGPHESSIVSYEYVEWLDGDRDVSPAD
jgi:hypothetical protein